MKKRIAIITTHPIQYNAPWFRLLAQEPEIQVKVFYTWSQSEQGLKFDPGFNRTIEWDIPVLDGYDYVFIHNISKDPGSHHFMGIDNPGLNKNVEAWKPDAIMVIGWAYKSNLSCMRYFKGKIPVFFRGDSTLLDEPPGYSIKKIVRKISLRWIYKKIDKAFYVGQNNKRYFQKFGLRENQLFYAPHAIDNNRFGNANSSFGHEALTWRRKFGIKDEDLVFLFAGKFEAKKSPLFLIETFARAAIPHSHLLLIGNGLQENELKQAAGNYGNIHFMDFQNQSRMPIVYRIGDVFILPSAGPGETWGLALNEAMACGRPVIASDRCGGAIDLIDERKGGFIFQSQNSDSLKKILLEFYDKRDTIKCMGSYNLDKIGKFSFKYIVEAIKVNLIAV